MNVIKSFGVVVILTLLISAVYYNRQQSFVKQTFFLMGTLTDITLPSEYTKEFNNIINMMKDLSDTVTHDSENISLSRGLVLVDNFTCQLAKESKLYSAISKGGFNAMTAEVTLLYGFPEGPFREPNEKELTKALNHMTKNSLQIEERVDGCYVSSGGVAIDFGAYAKGAIVDRVAEYLLKQGVNNFIINCGGDLYASGKKNKEKWLLGIRDPYKKSNFIEAVSLKDKGLATSGTYERFFIDKNGNRISHLFDGRSGLTADKYISVSVIAETAKDADALSTAYFFMTENEIEAACKVYNTPVLLLKKGNKRIPLCGWDNYTYLPADGQLAQQVL